MQKRERRRALTRCRNCSRSKVKCSRGFPCERCFSLCLVCSAPNGDTRPFMDVVLSSVDHAHVVQTFMEVFTHLHAQANVDRAAMLPELRTWRNVSLRTGTDVTLGIFEHVCRALNVSAHELEAVDEKELPREWYAHSHTSTFTSLSRACMGEGVPQCGDEDESGIEGPESPESTRARLHDDECLKALKEEDGAPTFVSVSTHTDVFLSVEECGSSAFCTTEQANTYVSSYRMHPLVLIASMISPSDRQLWFKAYLSMFSTTTGPNSRHTTMVKFCGIDGSIDLYILRVRKAMLTPYSSNHRRASRGSPRTVAITASFEKVPASRHVTRRPGFRHHIIEGFRQGSHSTPNHTNVANVADTTNAMPVSTARVDQEKLGSLKDLPMFRLPLLESLPLPVISTGDMQRLLERDTSIFAPPRKRLKHLFADTRSTSIAHDPSASTATSDMPPTAISPLASSSSARTEATHTDADAHTTKPYKGLITATTSTLVRAITPGTPTNTCCDRRASKSTSTQTLSLTIETGSPRSADALSPCLHSDTQAHSPTHVEQELPHRMQVPTLVGGMSRRAIVGRKAHAQTPGHGTQSVDKGKGEAAKEKEDGAGERGEGNAVGEVVGDVVAKYMHRTQQVLANAGIVRADSDPTFYSATTGWHPPGPALSDYTAGVGVGARGVQRGFADARVSGSSVATINRSATRPSILQHAHMSKRDGLDGSTTTTTTTSPADTTATPNTTHHPLTFCKAITPLVHTVSPRLRGGSRIIQDIRSPHANRLNAKSSIEDAHVSRGAKETAAAESPAFKHQHGWRGFDALLQAMLLSDSSEARLCSEPHGPTRDNNTRSPPPITVTAGLAR